MANVSDVLDLARDHGIDYDVRFAADQQAFREITRIERDLLEIVLRMAPWGYPLPGDETETVDVTVYSTLGYGLPEDFWRVRGYRAVRGSWMSPIQIVDPVQATMVPQVHPSAWVEGNRIYPVDGVVANDGEDENDRRFGWNGVDEIHVLHVTEPDPKVGAEDVLDLPDDAVRVMSYELVNFFAKRGRTATSITAQIRQDAQEARERFLQNVTTFPGPRAFPVG